MTKKIIAAVFIVLLILVPLAYILFRQDPAPPPEPIPAADQPRPLTYSVVGSFPHDTSSFTEGLLFYEGQLYEGTGEYGQSKLLQVDLATGKPKRSFSLDPKYFGEGIVILRDTVYQWTYKEKTGFMYRLNDFRKLKEFTYGTEGWGMTTDGKEIIATDGTSNLFFYEPGTFRLLRTQPVTESGELSFNINELEYIDGYVYANQWQRPFILKIDPANGKVVAKADLTRLSNEAKAKEPTADVLNGIAYDPLTKKIYVTGKRWPLIYEVQFGN